jgi:phytoene synthase
VKRREVVALCRSIIAAGSKSFAFAARLFAAPERDATVLLYAWCRHCDDQIDEAGSATLAAARLDELRARTREAYHREAVELAGNPAFVALSWVAAEYAIPAHYPLELLEGMAMDVAGTRYETIRDLDLYCYRVAGVVGAMMTHIMGVSDEAALGPAVELGKAFQLTNIARDVLADAALGRVYLPLVWLREAGVDPEEIAAPAHRAAVAGVAGRLLAEAERRYAAARTGLPSLSFRSACAIAAALEIYRDIGTTVELRGAHAWDERVLVPGWRKAELAARGVAAVVADLPRRLRAPFTRVPIAGVVRHDVAHSPPCTPDSPSPSRSPSSPPVAAAVAAAAPHPT